MIFSRLLFCCLFCLLSTTTFHSPTPPALSPLPSSLPTWFISLSPHLLSSFSLSSTVSKIFINACLHQTWCYPQRHDSLSQVLVTYCCLLKSCHLHRLIVGIMVVKRVIMVVKVTKIRLLMGLEGVTCDGTTERSAQRYPLRLKSVTQS